MIWEGSSHSKALKWEELPLFFEYRRAGCASGALRLNCSLFLSRCGDLVPTAGEVRKDPPPTREHSG